MARMTGSSARHLRAIIQTQTEIAASDLELDAVMELIAQRAQDLTEGSGGVIEIAEATRWSTASPPARPPPSSASA